MFHRPALSSIAPGGAALLALATVLLTACGGGGDNLSSDASVRLVNATSDFPSLDLYQGSTQRYVGTLPYSAGSYVSSNAGGYTFNLQSTGSSTVAASVAGQLDKRKHATLVAYTTAGALNASFLSDEEGTPSRGTAKLRIFNTAKAEAGAVDVYLVASACSALQSSSVAATASAVANLQASYTQISAASGGTTYHLCVTAAGDKSDLRLDLASFTLTDQQVATLILVRSVGGVLLNGLVLNQQGDLVQQLNGSARLRVAAGATSAGTVGVTVNNVALGNFASPDVGGYTVVPAGALSVAATIGGAAVAATGLSAAPGADLTLLVAGTAAAPTVALLQDDNTASTSSAKPVKIRLVNGFAGSDTVTLSVDGSNVGSGAAFGTASTSAFVAASSQTTRLKATGPAGQLYLTTGNTLTSGSVYSLFLLGDPPATLPGLATGILRVDR